MSTPAITVKHTPLEPGLTVHDVFKGTKRLGYILERGGAFSVLGFPHLETRTLGGAIYRLTAGAK